MKATTIQNVLVTGGTGFIGSHVCVELLQNGYEVRIVDNLTNSRKEVLDSIERITGKVATFYEADIRDRAALETIFETQAIDAVVHCAGLKSVRESTENPLLYYDNNVYGSLVLLQTMEKYNVKSIVFSSSASVYGADSPIPYTEQTAVQPIHPYGRTKLVVEEMIREIAASDLKWRVVILRYFNPIGAHASGLLGENPQRSLDNLMPYLCQVALGLRQKVLVFGNDYETPDGTGVRDYIHIVDLAVGHVKAFEWLKHHTGVLTANLGTGKGVSVLELITAFGKASGKNIPYEIAARRAGDLPLYYADPGYANEKLVWCATRTVDDACRDAWRYIKTANTSHS